MENINQLIALFNAGDVMGIIRFLNLHYFLRIIIAAFCGFMIGRERKNRAKEAGVRTHCIVALASALMMIISKYAYFDLISGNLFPGADIRLDPSRVASTIVSGIGFLGAGMIFVQRQTVTGLTTAAGIWATAGIGMAIGAGMYPVGIVATVLILIIQSVLHKSSNFSKPVSTKSFYIENVEDINFRDEVVKFFADNSINITATYMERKNGVYNMEFIIDLPHDFDKKIIFNNFEGDCSLRQVN